MFERGRNAPPIIIIATPKPLALVSISSPKESSLAVLIMHHDSRNLRGVQVGEKAPGPRRWNIEVLHFVAARRVVLHDQGREKMP